MDENTFISCDVYSLSFVEDNGNFYINSHDNQKYLINNGVN